jgi:hypothetical protein
MAVLIGWFAQNNRSLVERLRAAERDFLTDVLSKARVRAEQDHYTLRSIG